MNPPGEITLLLQRVDAGEAQAAARILPLVYDELRKLAAAKMARESAGQTLQPTALVHQQRRLVVCARLADEEIEQLGG